LVRIDHVGVVVEDLARAVSVFEDGLGLSLVEQKEYSELGMKVAILEAENIEVELIQPIGPGPYWKNRKPHTHYNHLAVDMNTVGSIEKRLSESKISLLPERRRIQEGGYVQNLNPKTTMGLVIQLIKRENQDA
jgi:methylmalonyl-CoA/ethylmalonyl-CoA epimerase